MDEVQSIEAARKKLIALVSKYATSKGKNMKIKIWFDGKHTQKEQYRQNNIEVYYTPIDSSADEEIIKFIKRYKNKSNLKVISSDKAIIEKARKMGCQIQTAEDFSKELKTIYKKQQHEIEYKEKLIGISPADVDYWMKKFNFDDRADTKGK